MYGVLTDDMKAAIKAIVEDRTVYDLGAGTSEYAMEMLGMGAKHVTCIDKEPPHIVDSLRVMKARGRLDWKTQYFADLLGDICTEGLAGLKDVLFVSWPVNRKSGVSTLARIHENSWIIYLGSNRGGTACGSCELFFELTKREVQVEIQHPTNDLIIYKPGLLEHHRFRKGELTREERAYADRVEYEWSDKQIAFRLRMP